MFTKKNILDSDITQNSFTDSLVKDFFENSPLPMWFYDLNTWKFLAVNDSAAHYFGYSKEEFSRMTIKDLRIEEDLPILLENINNYNDAEPKGQSIRYKLKNGNLATACLSSHNIKHDGKSVRAVILHDSKEPQTETENENQISVRFDIGLGFGSFASWEIELTSGKILYDERKDKTFKHYVKKYKTFNDFLELLHPDDAVQMRQIVYDLIDGKISKYELEYRLKADNGKFHWFRDIGGIVERSQRNDVIRIMGITEDITERKSIQQELIAAKEKAEEINRVKSLFFSNMSHELRTPLTSILGYAELLYEEVQNEEHKHMLDSIFLSGQRLLDTFNEIVHISKIESQKLVPNFEKVLLPQIINDVITEYEPTIKRKGLYSEIITDSDDLYAYVDREMFDTIISNLVSNAIKFTQSGGITINCLHYELDDNPHVRVEISDTGIGIQSPNESFIFQEFRQVSEGLNRLYESTGLGLNLVKRYTEAMGGKISVLSELNKGTKFTLDFPLIAHDQQQQNGFGSSETNNDNQISVSNSYEMPAVLLVEDDICNRDLVKLYLNNICTLDHAGCGEDALTLVQKKKYDVILMDIGLGVGISGLDTTKVIRQIPGYESTPIIAVTAYAMNGEKEKFLNAGLSDYISKPFNNYELISKLNRALGKHNY